MKDIKKLTLSGLLISIGVITSTLVHIPIGPIKAFPVQHLINVMSVTLLGPAYAISNAFLISLTRNLLGTGSLLAFPGSLFGAFLAGQLYKKYRTPQMAFAGEFIGTGVLGAFVATLMAKYVLGLKIGASLLFASFMASSLIGASIALLLIKSMRQMSKQA